MWRNTQPMTAAILFSAPHKKHRYDKYKHKYRHKYRAIGKLISWWTNLARPHDKCETLASTLAMQPMFTRTVHSFIPLNIYASIYQTLS